MIDFRASAFATGLIALTLNVSAFNSETFRSGINSIRAGQRNAALALGMSEWQALRIVIIPQAIHRVLLPWPAPGCPFQRYFAGFGGRGR